VLYLSTDALYAEVARIPGLIAEIGRQSRVLILGPSLFPALLRTIHLGFVTLALEQKAGLIHELLGATRTEMLKMDETLERLARQAGTFTNTIERARTRTMRRNPAAPSSSWSSTRRASRKRRGSSRRNWNDEAERGLSLSGEDQWL
jgi:DNA anti-recombination protein RmuC